MNGNDEWIPKSGKPLTDISQDDEWSPKSGKALSDLPEKIQPKKTPKPQFSSPLDAIGMGQILSGNIPGALQRMETTRAIRDPKQGLSEALAIGGVASAITNPVATTVGLTAPKLLDIPVVSRGADISQEYVSKIPKQLLGSTEPILGAFGVAGELARRTTPEQYKNVLKGAVGALAATSVHSLDTKYQNWAKNIVTPPVGEPSNLTNLAIETNDLAKSAKTQIQNDYRTFREQTGDIPLVSPQKNHMEDVNNTLASLYENSSKIEKSINEKVLPQEFIDEMGNIAKEDAPRANLGLVYKIKDAISKHIKWNSKYVTDSQKALRESYFSLDKTIDDVLSASGKIEEKQYLDALNQSAESIYDTVSGVEKLTRGKTKITPTASRILGASSTSQSGAETYEILRRLQEVEPRVRDVLDKIKGYHTTKNIKEFLGRAGLITAEGIAVGTALRTMGGLGKK